MSISKFKQQPIKLPDEGKRELRTQFGALCYRMKKDKLKILMITSRSGKRWILPKGWPIDGATPAKAAAREAFEEAGAEGKVGGHCLGIYSYYRDFKGDDMPCVVAIYPLHVKKVHAIFPEKGQRKRKWVSQKKAVEMVENPELGQIIKNFHPERFDQ